MRAVHKKFLPDWNSDIKVLQLQAILYEHAGAYLDVIPLKSRLPIFSCYLKI